MTLSTFSIPLIKEPQQFEITLAGIDYIITCKWNDAPDAGWVLDFSDLSAVPIVTNIPLVLGTDLLEGLAYLGFQGSLFVFNDGNDLSPPTLANLGVISKLYFQTEVESG